MHNVYRLLALTLLIFGGMFTGCNEKKNDNKEAPETDATLIMGRLGCFGCHTEDGTGFRGPSFKGIFGRPTVLQSGDTIIIDEAYLRKSILDPAADMVKGYPQGLMPKTSPSEHQLNLIINYLKKFKYSDALDSASHPTH